MPILDLTADQSQLTDDSGLQISENCPRHVLASASFAEESVERVVPAADSLIAGHQTIGLDAVLQAVQLPARISHLDASLADMD